MLGKGDNGEPTVCVTPRSKPEVRTFYMCSKAFDIFSSVYLLKHGNLRDAPKLLQYRHVIQKLFERGGYWREYDESFRSLRSVEGWAWDQMHSQLWLMSAQQPAANAVPHMRPPFIDKGPGPRGGGVHVIPSILTVSVYSIPASLNMLASGVWGGLIQGSALTASQWGLT